jgi:hypothetical protein
LDELFNIYEWLSGINFKSWASAGDPERGSYFSLIPKAEAVRTSKIPSF